MNNKFENVYIMSLEAKSIIKAMDNHGGYNTKKQKRSKLFTASLPYSLDLMELQNIAPKEFYNKGRLKYTNAIINVKFTYPLYKYVDKIENDKVVTDAEDKKVQVRDEMLYSKLQLREKLYQDGFVLNGNHYVFFARSSSKAKEGSVLFIRKYLADRMIKTTRMGLEFDVDEEVDIASLLAYSALSLSAIIDTVEIKPEQILIIDEHKSKFITTASVTRSLENESLDTNEEEIEITNELWDGQSLADVSLFPKDENGNMKGCMLLRNRFFKSCAFNVNLQQWFYDNNITEVTDMFGRVHRAEDIKIVTTPNSLKLFKLDYKISDAEDNKDRMRDTWDYWLNNISSTFGICKHEKQSFWNGIYNQLSYQILNSIPFDEDDIKALLKDEIDYIKLLQNDISVFKNYIGCEDTLTKDFMFNILAINDDIQRTKLFREYRNELVRNYKNNLRQGHVKIKGTDYAIAVGNPIQMLQKTIGQEIKYLHKGRQIYCSRYKDSEEVVILRNPHVCSGNVLVVENKWHDEFKYLNLNDNIVIINAHDNDILQRLNGQDYDSDQDLITNEPTLLKRAKECLKYPTPVNAVKAETKKRTFTPVNCAEVDDIIAENLIGDIINTSQILNSYYWEEYNKKDAADKEKLKLIYKYISMLAAMSNIEIDKSKKLVNVNMKRQLDLIRGLIYNEKPIFEKEKIMIDKSKEELTQADYKLLKEHKKDKKKIKEILQKEATRTVRPMFFKYVGDDNFGFRYFNTPMDLLEKEIDNIKGANRGKGEEYLDIVDLMGTFNPNEANRKQINVFADLVEELDKNIKALFADIKGISSDDYLDLQKQREELKRALADEIKKKKVTIVTIANVFKRIYSGNDKDRKLRKYKMLLLSTLYNAHTEKFEKVFKYSPHNVAEKLVEYEDGDINIWGKRYKKVKGE